MKKIGKRKAMMLCEVKVSYKSKITPSKLQKISDSREAYKLAYEIFDPEILDHHEEMVILLLNRANKFLGWAKISQGGISSTVIDPKIIYQYALKTNASGIMIVHNHPSGNLQPSESDVKLTNQIKEGCKILDIILMEHLIITSEKGKYFSFSDEGKL